MIRISGNRGFSTDIMRQIKAAPYAPMRGAPRVRAPQAVLFACGLNSVRSPMAASLLQQMFPHALYVRSAGVTEGRTRSVRGRGDGRTRPGHLAATSR